MKKYSKISKVLWLILVANLIVALIKVSIGLIFRINSLTADGFHSVTDSTSNIIGIIGIKIASKPADKDHPYGYQKFETVSSMVIGFMLFIITLRIIYGAIMWFITPITPYISVSTLIALLATLIINIIVARFEYKKGKEYHSDVLVADSIHTKSDILISFGVLVAMISIKLGAPAIIDPLLSLIISVFVFLSCIGILKSTSSVLVDKKAIDEEKIVSIVKEVDKDILDVHKIRSRGLIDNIYIDLHIITDPNKTVKDAHELSHRIEDALRCVLKKDVELIAHIEPYEVNHLN